MRSRQQCLLSVTCHQQTCATNGQSWKKWIQPTLLNYSHLILVIQWENVWRTKSPMKVSVWVQAEQLHTTLTLINNQHQRIWHTASYWFPRTSKFCPESHLRPTKKSAALFLWGPHRPATVHHIHVMQTLYFIEPEKTSEEQTSDPSAGSRRAERVRLTPSSLFSTMTLDLFGHSRCCCCIRWSEKDTGCHVRSWPPPTVGSG